LKTRVTFFCLKLLSFIGTPPLVSRGEQHIEHMSTEEVRQFLLEKARTGKLATVRDDGRPHIAPIWIDLDGDTIVFTTGHDSIKAATIRRDSRVAICVDDDRPPFAFVIIEGTASITDNREELRYWATRIAGRYMGEELAEAYGKRNSVEGELLVKVTPSKIIAWKKIAD
jgi:PPOX class probable F420-dependent enzyme